MEPIRALSGGPGTCVPARRRCIRPGAVAVGTPYVRMLDVPEWVWAQLVTWAQLVSEEQAEELQAFDQTPGSTFGR